MTKDSLLWLMALENLRAIDLPNVALVDPVLYAATRKPIEPPPRILPERVGLSARNARRLANKPNRRIKL